MRLNRIKKWLFLAVIPCGLSAHLIHVQDERAWLAHNYLPQLEGRILYVGVGSYTAHYHTYAKKNPHLFETIDYLQERAQFGSPYRHYVADFQQFQPGYLYDHISLFGLFGYYGGKYTPIENEEEITACLNKADALLQVGGTLQIGPNHEKVPEMTEAFWLKRFQEPPLDRYEVIFNGIGPQNMVWWARKLCD